jgi:hypothetical protein
MPAAFHVIRLFVAVTAVTSASDTRR